MADAHLILVHGPPGAGKSTVCNEIHAISDLAYVDLASSSLFRQAPMDNICSSLYLQNHIGKSFVTEGVFPKRQFRDAFVAKVAKKICEEACLQLVPFIVYLSESPTALSQRRRRSADEYRKIINSFQLGSRNYPYHVIQASSLTVTERAQEILKLYKKHAIELAV